MNSLAALGRTDEVRQRAEAMLPVAVRSRLRSEVALAYALNAGVSQFTGDWVDARDFSERCFALSPTHTQALFARTLIESEMGDDAASGEYIQRLIEAVRLAGPGPNLPRAYLAAVIPLASRMTGDTSRLDQAETEAISVVSSPSATPFAAFLARIGLAMKAVVQNDAEGAREQYGALEGRKGTVFFISADRLLGILARTMGRMDDARSHFEDAIGFCRRAGYRPELAWTCFDYAELMLDYLAASDGTGSGPVGGEPAEPQERARAASFLDEALAITRELGMRPLLERVLSRRKFLNA